MNDGKKRKRKKIQRRMNGRKMLKEKEKKVKKEYGNKKQQKESTYIAWSLPNSKRTTNISSFLLQYLLSRRPPQLTTTF